MTNNKRKISDMDDEGVLKVIWLLIFVHQSNFEFTFDGGRCSGHNRRIQFAFSSKEKAIFAMPEVMDKYCPHGTDWRNGLKGFGRSEYDNYLRYSYFGDSILDEGVLLDNTGNTGSDMVQVSIKMMEVDPLIR
mmetsp:Transcript_5227/g.9960  ORF Transcript_5227/g.9960 Transcript_5227/m.9960 type:complete len:133 (+) Transcript_5227:68-466(+)